MKKIEKNDPLGSLEDPPIKADVKTTIIFFGFDSLFHKEILCALLLTKVYLTRAVQKSVNCSKRVNCEV